MGDIDIRVKNFVKLRSIFAQLFSEGVFHGKVEIDPDKLQELDTVNQETVRKRGRRTGSGRRPQGIPGKQRRSGWRTDSLRVWSG